MYKISKLTTTQQAKLLKKTLIINFIYLECMNLGGGVAIPRISFSFPDKTLGLLLSKTYYCFCVGGW